MRVLLGLVACGGSVDAPCGGLTGAEADGCLVEQFVARHAEAPAEAERILASISDPALRDLALLTATRRVDPSSDALCQRIEREDVRERCLVLVRRPHLHEHLGGEE